ncbi:carbohydrate ABC transporter permease [Ketogulonicigenium vulgare]|uniref:Putative sugar ABC transporter, permease component n=1 Tax=Ketogulonicigenium vulgare (strain WSH-001) TaxID=759362 RepID=F9Y8M8_KETVW|nr:sugar ABC transporter permease [Ketogulonicigenium vulgare]ADO43016.1 binding-protein-dependent transport systems inner membrane component [Ketogulonicigenium vulgare Y25]AEM41197.1 putative sugar ABC transporter, permease component [Ketogulonicigenium vulgare WSH-001]ALJ81338.1 sugar ABC transporter permease [Ketogulonicigenium vulgare]ANW34072.1 sugar ABC transporter permease [Ketogulonicigenium vulgare]AOZ54926.1 binding-protein-dependent transporters inner membrane component [Ketoguloni
MSDLTGATRQSPAPSTPARARRGRPQSQWWTVWVFLMPALLLFLYFKFIPMFAGIEMSFQQVRPFLGNLWVGWDNYARVVTDPRFHSAISNTILLGVGQSVGAVLGGLLLALLLEGPSRVLWFIRTAAFLPVVTATAVVGEIWRIIFFPAPNGFLNSVIGLFGMGPLRYLEDPAIAIYSVMAVGIWQNAPYYMVIFLAGLAGVDRSLYEAAAIDGAKLRHRLLYVTLPALRPAMMIVMVLAAVRCLRVFTDVWVLTGGGPAGATEVWMTRIYSLGFERNQIGLAAAASILLLITSVVLTMLAVYLTRARRVK